MRLLLVSLAMIALVSGAASAQDEKRIFIVTSNSGDYRAARCLENGEKCGAEMAAAYCKTRDYARALSYRKVSRQEITGGVPMSNSACGGGKCEEFVAIECGR
jgi:hypothetical protein